MLREAWSEIRLQVSVPFRPSFRVFVVDVATGEMTYVVKGGGSVWLDDHTLIVERTGCPGSHGRYEKCFG